MVVAPGNIELINNPDTNVQNVERKVLVDNLTNIACNGFGTDITSEDVENHVLKVQKLYLIRKQNEIVGFSSYDQLMHEGKNILYLSGIVVKQEYQKQGIFYEINQIALAEKDFDYLVMRTQNPVIYAATQKIVKKIFPTCNKMPKNVKNIGVYIALEHLCMQNFEQDTFIGRNTYSGNLYDIVQRHERANELFDDILGLNYDAGDSILIVGCLK